MNDMIQFFSEEHPQLYLLALAAGGLACALLFFFALRRRQLPMRLLPVFGALSLVLGGLFSRLLVLLCAPEGVSRLASHLFSPDSVRGFAFFGALLGVLSAAFLSDRLLRLQSGTTGDAFAVSGLVLIALARFSQGFVSFGAGPYVEVSSLQIIPFAMPDGFGDWTLSVFLLEGLWALGCAAFVAQRKTDARRLPLALALICCGQLLFEGLKAEYLRFMFIRVQQVFPALILLYLLLASGKERSKKRKAFFLFLFILQMGLLVVCAYTLDGRMFPLPATTVHIIMGLVACLCAMLFAHTLGKPPRQGADHA